MQSIAWLIVGFPLFGFLFNAVSGFLFKDKALQKRLVSLVAPGVVLASFLVSLGVLQAVMGAPEHRLIVPMIPGFAADFAWIDFAGFKVNFALLLDPLSMLMTMIVTGVGGLIHIYAVGYMADDREQPRFFTYFNLFILMMLLLVLGENFLLMFVGWEGVGSCSYLLISFWYTDTNNAKAGNKAFIVNRVGDLGFALGMMAIWSVFGTLSFFGQGEHAKGVMDLAKAGLDVNGNLLGQTHFTLPFIGVKTAVSAICLLLFIGACGKSAQIPLWVWLPDAMAGPTPVSALIHAATMVTAGVVMLTRCSWLFVLAPDVLQIVAWVGALTAFMGATIGLVQNDIKRVLAFSTVSQLGYMFLACGVGNFTAGMFHVTTHAFFKALLFLGSGAVIHSMLGEQDMRKMGGLKPKIPRTWALMAVGTYTIAGFPFLSGFFSKDDILGSAAASPWGNGAALYGIGIVTALMTAFYMNRLMWKTFYTDPRFVDGELEAHHHSNFDEEEAAHGHDAHNAADGEVTDPEAAHGHGHGGGKVHESPQSMMLPLYVLAFLSLFAGLALGPLTKIFEKFLEPSVAHLPAGFHHASLLPNDVAGYIISALVAFLGLGYAHAVYSAHRKTGEWIPEAQKRGNPVYWFLMNKWLFDAIYNFLFITVGGWIADKLLWRTLDAGIIDGAANGAASGIGKLSGGLRKLQTGYVRNYALGILVGVVILVAGLLYKINTVK